MSFEVFQRTRPRQRERRPYQHAVRDRVIRAAFKDGVSRTELAALFGLGHARISQIIADDPELSTR